MFIFRIYYEKWSEYGYIIIPFLVIFSIFQRHVARTENNIQQGRKGRKADENAHYIRVFAGGLGDKNNSHGKRFKAPRTW